MKRILAATAAILLGCTAFTAVNVSAADSATVYVTIADGEGKLALAHEPITVTDTDNDGALTISDALYAAHEAKFEGGAAAGYGTAETQYGLSLAKLWGVENGGSYGYYLNDKSAWSLADPVTDRDVLNAFVYTDTTAWSDAYAWFNVSQTDTKTDTPLTLTLYYNKFDENFNPVATPVSGATITINGAPTEIVTDANGAAKFDYFAQPGDYVISAVSESQRLVPPVCVVSVADAATAPETEQSVDETTTTSETTTAVETTTTADTTAAPTTVATSATTAMTVTTTTAANASTTAATTAAAASTTAATVTSSAGTGDNGIVAVMAGAAVAALGALIASRKHED